MVCPCPIAGMASSTGVAQGVTLGNKKIAKLCSPCEGESIELPESATASTKLSAELRHLIGGLGLHYHGTVQLAHVPWTRCLAGSWVVALSVGDLMQSSQPVAVPVANDDKEVQKRALAFHRRDSYRANESCLMFT